MIFGVWEEAVRKWKKKKIKSKIEWKPKNHTKIHVKFDTFLYRHQFRRYAHINTLLNLIHFSSASFSTIALTQTKHGITMSSQSRIFDLTEIQSLCRSKTIMYMFCMYVCVSSRFVFIFSISVFPHVHIHYRCVWHAHMCVYGCVMDSFSNWATLMA